MTNSSLDPELHYQLVVAVTRDGVKLHGLFLAANATDDIPQTTALDAAVILHGLGGNFYNSTLNLNLAHSLRDCGISVVLANTRGHDGISMSTVAGRAQTIGAAFEMVDDCREDVRGWAQWLAEKGFRRIALVGHSLGAIKSLYAQAHEPHEHVTAIAALSATRLSHQHLLNSSRRADFTKWFQLASQLVAEGQGDTLLHVDFPFPTHITAAAYRDKYGPADRYNWMAFADGITVPVLLIFGEAELRDNPAFQGMLNDVQPLVDVLPNYELQIIASADHFYSGVHHRACDAVVQWVGKFR